MINHSSFQRQFHYSVCNLVSGRFSDQFPNDLPATNDIMLWLALDAVPIDQCETDTSLIRGDPSPPVWFAGEHRTPLRKIDNRWRQPTAASECFVAIHREIKVSRLWNKGNGAHQSAKGYDSAATEYCRQFRQ